MKTLCACAICLASSGVLGDTDPPAPPAPRTPGNALSIGPPQTIDVESMDLPMRPVAGQLTQLTSLTLHNSHDTAAHGVAYTVTDSTHAMLLASGVVPHIPAKGEVTVAPVDITPALGASTITFAASGPNNKSASKSISKTLFAAAPGMELRTLYAPHAATGSSSATGCSAKASIDGSLPDKLHAHAALSTRCQTGAGKGSFVLFSGIKLKNGWKIAQVATTETTTGDSTWAFTAGPPAVGTNSAEMKLEMDVKAGASVDVAVTVYVQGPVGSAP